MRLTVLGCSGGIGGERRTTSLLIDEDVLIDCGTGVADLSIDELSRIEHIFLTHTHLDHIACLPLLLDTIQDRQGATPIQLHLTEASLETIQNHLFNWKIWPDFFAMPDTEQQIVQPVVHRCDEPVVLVGRVFTMLPVKHTIPAVGYSVESPSGKMLAFSGDCTQNTEFWGALNGMVRLDLLLVECSYTEHDIELSRKSGHYCSRTLADDLKQLNHQPQLYITHLKPGDEVLLATELEEKIIDRNPKILKRNDVFEL